MCTLSSLKCPIERRPGGRSLAERIVDTLELKFKEKCKTVGHRVNRDTLLVAMSSHMIFVISLYTAETK